jgi:hypothetical protein
LLNLPPPAPPDAGGVAGDGSIRSPHPGEKEQRDCNATGYQRYEKIFVSKKIIEFEYRIFLFTQK